MKRSTMKKLINALTITTVASTVVLVILATERGKYENTFRENMAMKKSIEGSYNVNNNVRFDVYHEIKKDVSYKIVLTDGTYATIDREAKNYIMYIKYIGEYGTTFESEEDLITAIETYIVKHKYKMGF